MPTEISLNTWSVDRVIDALENSMRTGHMSRYSGVGAIVRSLRRLAETDRAFHPVRIQLEAKS